MEHFFQLYPRLINNEKMNGIKTHFISMENNAKYQLIIPDNNIERVNEIGSEIEPNL